MLQFRAGNYTSAIEKIKDKYGEYIESMSTCFTTGESDDKKFRALRDDVVIDSITYHKFVIPLVNESLLQIKEIFALFD